MYVRIGVYVWVCLSVPMPISSHLKPPCALQTTPQGESDAAKLLAREADLHELQGVLVERQSQIAQLTLEVSKVCVNATVCQMVNLHELRGVLVEQSQVTPLTLRSQRCVSMPQCLNNDTVCKCRGV